MALKKESEELLIENASLRIALKERLVSLGMSQQALQQTNAPVSVTPLSLHFPPVNTSLLYR